VKRDGVVEVFVIASVLEPGDEYSRKEIQQPKPIIVTCWHGTQRFSPESNCVIKVFDITSVLEASAKRVCKII
jgi:lysophospholipid acyltransferase (LPLAT)-like uncharacterized protein